MSISWQPAEPAPALVAHPPAAVSLDEAYGAIEQWEFYSHKRLDSPQRLAVEHMLATRADGNWAARTTGRAEPRQNGKGDELEVVEAWDLTQRGAPIVHTAHEIPTSTSAHLRLLGHLYSHRDLRRKVRKAPASNSYRAIEMVNGGVIVYRTRTAGGGRGLDDIARLVVDEAQHAQPEQLAASTPILAVNPNPQTNYTGSAGIEGRSAQWWMLRLRALQGGGGDFAWLEHSAEQVALRNGSVDSVRPDASDVSNWVQANHAFPERISPAFLAEQLKILGPELFCREHLCVWDPLDEGSLSAFGAGKWEACAGSGRPEGLRPEALGLAVSVELTTSALAACGFVDEVAYVKPLAHGPGIQWLVAAAASEQDLHQVDVVVDEHGPAKVLIPDLEAAGVRVKAAKTSEVLDAHAFLFDLVQQRRVRHESWPVLDAAVNAAVKRSVGDRWAWGRRQSLGDICVLESVTLAAWWAELNARNLIGLY